MFVFLLFCRERPDAPDVTVVITDGQSKFPTITKFQAVRAKEEGVTMIVIGVGNDTDHDELHNMATSDNFLYEVNDYDDLLTIHLDVARNICKGKTANNTIKQLYRTTTNLQ